MSAVVEPPVDAAPPPGPGPSTQVDPENPWLGLDSFSEETRGYFHGREEEIGELARRVQRKLLAILFGQSGLGKTSILRAGIVPRLRREGYCPVYVRIDYSPESPVPSEQIKQAIFRATESSGKWTRPGTAVAGETLWEFLHHRDDVLRDTAGKTLTPLLIFDQFEEIFTLGQDNDFGRKRAAEFIEDLGDLVENRPPRAIEAKIEKDDALAERFDFNRADYRILIALREDYLAHLEGLKGAMPSITQNRMRLARMTGDQALAAVVKPGGRLVSEEVAESIVRFIAGGAELRNAEVEPSLLSLVCRELNNARIAQGRSEISADLLAGSRDTILNEFYERSLADQPAGVRRFIEDEMLTESGFRESLAEERVIKAFATAGAAPGALASLVNRRLLRIEERLDVRRVELTHDVLCAVVKASRDMRHEREARDEAERQLQAQREREAATHRALIRARQIATGCAVLAIVAVAGAFFGWQNMKRAQEAEANALKTRTMAEGARSEAEKLVVYLLDDFYLELEPVGRLDVVGDLSRRAIEYYAALPPELRDAQTDRNRSLALVRYGWVLRNRGKLDEAAKALDEAIATLDKVRKAGDTSDAAAIGHALALSGRARTYDSTGRLTDGLPLAEQATQILEPFMKGPNPSVALKRAAGVANNYWGYAQMRAGREEDSAKTLEIARAAYRSVDDLAVGDLPSAAGYAESSAWLVDALNSLGRDVEARKVGEDGIKVSSAVLEKRPAHMPALRARALLQSALAGDALTGLRIRKALAFADAAMRDWEGLLKLDPGNTIAWGNLGVSQGEKSRALYSLGRITEGIEVLRSTKALAARAGPANLQYLAGTTSFHEGWIAAGEAELGHREASKEAFAEHLRFGQIYYERLAKDAFPRVYWPEWGARFETMIAESYGDFAGMRDKAMASVQRMDGYKTAHAGQERLRNEVLAWAHSYAASANYQLHEYGAAEREIREAMKARERMPKRTLADEMDTAETRALLAMILARENRLADARAAVEPALALHRKLRAAGSDDVFQHEQLARTLYAAALAMPPQAPGLLGEAARILDGLPVEIQHRPTTSRLRAWINEEAKKRG
jgi:tetratricopeptide (TPR) repeat protein